MAETVLKVPIQIRGGTSVPTTSIKDRELFIDTKNGNLYYGYSNKFNSIKPTVMDGSGYSISNDGINFGYMNFYHSEVPEDSKFNGLQGGPTSVVNTISTSDFYKSNDINDDKFRSKQIEVLKAFNIYHSQLNNVKLINNSLINTYYITLAGTSYGSSLPKTGVEGQLYFKI